LDIVVYTWNYYIHEITDCLEKRRHFSAITQPN
jgi:hypothetical protein